MIVQCIANTLEVVTDDLLLNQLKQDIHLDKLPLEIGKYYCVFGLSMSASTPRYLVCEEERDWYPVPHHAVFFRVVDREIPNDWVYVDDGYNLGRYALLPKIWASNPRFLEKLVDGDLAAVAEFSDIKECQKSRLDAFQT